MWQFVNAKGPVLVDFRCVPDICLPMVAPGKGLGEMFMPGSIDINEVGGQLYQMEAPTLTLTLTLTLTPFTLTLTPFTLTLTPFTLTLTPFTLTLTPHPSLSHLTPHRWEASQRWKVSHRAKGEADPLRRRPLGRPVAQHG